MVATRRGVRVSSPAKTSTDQSSDVPPTPSTGRRTRRTAKGAESPTHHVLVETSSQLEKKETTPPASPPTSLMKRCTRASRLHSPEQPCTPVGSTHEADVSDLESCCSTRSDIEPASTRTRSRRKPAPVVSQEDEEISEVESYSSVSRQKVVRSSRRSTRKTTVAPEKSDPAHVEAGDVNVDKALESKSCNSVVSESNRATRSQRRTTRTRSSAKQQTEDSEVSDADSCASSVSGVSKSSTRRPAKPRRQINPIPLDLQDPSEGSQSPAPTGRRTRATRGKAAATTDVSEPQSCDSEGFESGPSYSMSTRRRGKAKTVDSDSEPTDLHSPMSSPCSTRSRGTPCSSRTGSGNSSRGASASRRSLKDLSIVLERASELIEEDISLNDSRLETTVIAADADCTLLEEDDSQTLEEKVGANSADVSSNEVDTKTVEEGEKKEVVGDDQPVVMVIDQQEEPSAENKDGDTSEMEGMQEMIQSSVPSQPSVTVTVREKVIEITEEEGDNMEVSGVGTQPSQGEKAADEDAVEEIQASTEERMEVTAQINTDAQQVVEAESIRVTSKHQDKTVRLDFDSEQKPEQKDIVVQKTKVISLLDSSDDEDVEEEDDDDDEEVEEEEDERGGPSKKPEAAASSVDGLFMIDTRPGEEADEHYFTERPTTEHEEATNKDAEQDEEFVDEEGDDDDEDDDADILFSSRNPQAKELSSCIDPGIRVKELGGLYINFDGSKSKPVSSSLQKLKEKKIQDELMKKSIIGPDFEKKDAVPPYSESKRALKLKHKEEREKTTGDGWFNMKAPEIDQEQKRDLQVLKMRGALDPKRFYKKNDRDGFPKYFQVGTVVDSAVDFYHSRIPKKQRKRTIVEELLADAEFRHNNKKKYKQIVTEKAAQAAGKRSRKKNKFHKK